MLTDYISAEMIYREFWGGIMTALKAFQPFFIQQIVDWFSAHLITILIVSVLVIFGFSLSKKAMKKIFNLINLFI